MGKRKLEAYPIYLILSGGTQLANIMIFTVLAVYYVTMIGMNPLQLVLVGTVLETTIFLFEIPTGVVADTFSRRLSVIIGMFVLGVAFVFEGSISLVVTVMLAEIIRGIGETFISGAREAWIADEVGEGEVARVYLRATQVRQVAALIGIGASVSLASLQLTLPIVLGGGLYLALGLFLVLTMPERGFQPTPRGERSSWQMLGSTFQNGVHVVRGQPVLLTILSIGILAGAASEGLDRLWEAHLLTNFSFPTLGALKPVVWFGIINAATIIGGLLATEILRRRVDTVSRSPQLTAWSLLGLETLSVVTIIAFGVANNFMWALGALLAKSVAGSLAGPLHSAWLVQNINPKVRATVLSMSSLTDAFGQTTGGPVIGVVGTTFSLRTAMVVTGGVLSLTLPLYAQVVRRNRNILAMKETQSNP